MFLRFFLLCGFVAAPSFGASAQDLTLPDAVERALQHHPGLRAETHAVDAIAAKARHDALAPPLTIGGELENVGGTGAVSGVNGAEATVRLGRTFELGDKPAARRAAGQAEVERQRFRIDLRRLDIVAETTKRFTDVLERQALLALAEREIEVAGEVRDAAAYRVERAASPESDLKLAEIAQARADLEREHAAHELLSARVALAVAFDALEPDFARADGDLEVLPPVDTLATLRARIEQTVEHRSYTLDAAVLDAQQRLARTQRSPDVTTSVGVRRLETLDDQALVFSVSLPFGLSERGALAESRVVAERAALDERRRATLLESYRTIFATYQELVHARTEFETLGRSMIPKAEEAVTLTQRGYDQARFSFVQLTQARSVALELRKQRIAAAARYHRLRADLERATAPFEGTTP